MLGGCHLPITQEGMGKEVRELCFGMTHDGKSDKQMQEHETMDPTDKDKRGEC